MSEALGSTVLVEGAALKGLARPGAGTGAACLDAEIAAGALGADGALATAEGASSSSDELPLP